MTGGAPRWCRLVRRAGPSPLPPLLGTDPRLDAVLHLRRALRVWRDSCEQRASMVREELAMRVRLFWVLCALAEVTR